MARKEFSADAFGNVENLPIFWWESFPLLETGSFVH